MRNPFSSSERKKGISADEDALEDDDDICDGGCRWGDGMGVVCL